VIGVEMPTVGQVRVEAVGVWTDWATVVPMLGVKSAGSVAMLEGKRRAVSGSTDASAGYI